MLPAKRKLNFDSPQSPANVSDVDLETDPTFPLQWVYEDVDIEARITKLRSELIARGEADVQMPAEDRKSKFRTEYRRILTALELVKDAIKLQTDELHWLHSSIDHIQMSTEALKDCQASTEIAIGEMKEKLSRLDVGILKSTQSAVKWVLALRDDEYMGEDCDINLADEYQKFNNLSKLCDVALKSYSTLKKRTEEMQKELIARRNKQRKHQEAMRMLMGEVVRRRVDEATHVFQNVSTKQLREMYEKMKPEVTEKRKEEESKLSYL